MEEKLTKSQRTNARRAARSEEQIIADRWRLRPDGKKKCPQCDESLDFSQFSRDKFRADGLLPMCMNCWGYKRKGRKEKPYYKQCSGCGNRLHINEFSADLDACHECTRAEAEKAKLLEEREKAAAKELRANSRKCKNCSEWKPKGEFAGLGSRLSSVCDTCTPVPVTPRSGFKTCVTCKIEFPLNEFAGDSRSPDSKGRYCIECRKKTSDKTAQRRSSRTESQIKDDQRRLRPNGRKTCSKCKKEYILDEFGRNVYSADGCGNWCKKCLRRKNAKSAWVNNQRTDAQVEAQRRKLRPEGVKACRHCRKSKEFDQFHENRRLSDGLSQTCKDCTLQSRAGRDFIIKELRLRYGKTCLYPGCESTKLTIDHVTPLSKGGGSDLDNYQQLCASHNSSKGSEIVDYRP